MQCVHLLIGDPGQVRSAVQYPHGHGLGGTGAERVSSGGGEGDGAGEADRGEELERASCRPMA